MVIPGEGTGEQPAKKWFRQILLGLSYVHSMVSLEREAVPVVDYEDYDYGTVQPLYVPRGVLGASPKISMSQSLSRRFGGNISDSRGRVHFPCHVCLVYKEGRKPALEGGRFGARQSASM